MPLFIAAALADNIELVYSIVPLYSCIIPSIFVTMSPKARPYVSSRALISDSLCAAINSPASNSSLYMSLILASVSESTFFIRFLYCSSMLDSLPNLSLPKNPALSYSSTLWGAPVVIAAYKNSSSFLVSRVDFATSSFVSLFIKAPLLST